MSGASTLLRLLLAQRLWLQNGAPYHAGASCRSEV